MWIPGKINELQTRGPKDLPDEPPPAYLVKLDPPINEVFSVPQDLNTLVIAERCFGQREGDLLFTLFCMPTRLPKKLRFDVGERVACAVEDATDNYTDWKAGTVLGVNHSLENFAEKLLPIRDWGGDEALVPYRVELDNGFTVFVHRDEHWLIRDLALQAEGPRQSADGTRDITRT